MTDAEKLEALGAMLGEWVHQRDVLASQIEEYAQLPYSLGIAEGGRMEIYQCICSVREILDK